MTVQIASSATVEGGQVRHTGAPTYENSISSVFTSANFMDFQEIQVQSQNSWGTTDVSYSIVVSVPVGAQDNTVGGLDEYEGLTYTVSAVDFKNPKNPGTATCP